MGFHSFISGNCDKAGWYNMGGWWGEAHGLDCKKNNEWKTVCFIHYFVLVFDIKVLAHIAKMLLKLKGVVEKLKAKSAQFSLFQ